jgi:S1-C subfamily serine protease
MIRKGVVTITVTAHVILDKCVNAKLWFGTGFIVDSEKGLIMTNAHIAGEMAVCTYEVKFGNGKKAEAKLEYIDPCYDFAVLSVNKNDIPQYCSALKFADAAPSINMSVYAMGNSVRSEFSTYQGYIFDTESILWLKAIAEQSFQFSGLSAPGASGSPVFNSKGEVIGILYGGKFVSGAALPNAYFKPVVDSIKQGKPFHRHFYGFIPNYTSLQDAFKAGKIPENAIEEYEKTFPNSNDKILYISKKLDAFGADKLQLETGDIIWQVDGEIIGSNLIRIDEIAREKAGKPIIFTIYRNGKKKEVEVPTYELNSLSKVKLLSFAGTTFFETTNEIKLAFGKGSKGVYIIDSEGGSPFAAVSSPIDGNYNDGAFKIISIDGKKVDSIEDVMGIIPSLFKKNVFEVKFEKLGGDLQPYSVITKHSPEFSEAALYSLNQDSKTWDVKIIKNPSQD